MALATMFAASLGDVLLKLLTGGYPLWQLITVNSFAAVSLILVRAYAHDKCRCLLTKRLTLHLQRGALGIVSVFSAVYALKHLPLPLFYTFAFTSPIILCLLCNIFLREPIPARSWAALIVGFIGVGIAFAPALKDMAANENIFVGALSLLLCEIVYGFSIILIRRMRDTESTLALSFYPFLSDLCFAAILWLALGGVPYTHHDLGLNLMAGGVALLANLAQAKAYKLAPASLISPVQYTQLIWGSLFSVLFWQHWPTPWTLAGAAFIMIAGWFLTRQTKGQEAI